MIMREADAARQDIRPLRVALLNLMPLKEKTEIQIARLIGATPLQVEVTLLTTGSYTPGNVSKQHLLDFYHPWQDVADQYFDGLIITGAPVELLDFEEVAYWKELVEIFEWSQQHVHSTFSICWGAQAALYHFCQVPKVTLPQKVFGLFHHRVVRPHSTLLRGFNDRFRIPVSRHTETPRRAIAAVEGLKILAESHLSGVCLVTDPGRRQVYMFNHLEYDANTLADEYNRDVDKGEDIRVPHNYFPGDDPQATPINSWRAHAHLLMANWLNDVYQTTPYRIEEVGDYA